VAVALGLGCVLLVPWRLGLMGAGDLKLAVGAAIWCGAGAVLDFVLYAALAGGVLVLPYVPAIVLRGRAGAALAGTGSGAIGGALRGASARRTVPFGVAIAAGAAATVWRWP
jgi:prepilin peptidase CpaA